MHSESDLTMDLINALETLKRSHWRPEVDLPVTPSEMTLLLCLHHHCVQRWTGMQPSELGERLQIARPTVTSLVNALEARGFVRRHQGTPDRRAVLVELTSEGRQLVEEGRCMFEEHMRRLVEFLGAEDARELIRLIRRVQQFSEMRKPKCGN